MNKSTLLGKSNIHNQKIIKQKDNKNPCYQQNTDSSLFDLSNNIHARNLSIENSKRTFEYNSRNQKRFLEPKLRTILYKNINVRPMEIKVC